MTTPNHHWVKDKDWRLVITKPFFDALNERRTQQSSGQDIPTSRRIGLSRQALRRQLQRIPFDRRIWATPRLTGPASR